MGRHKTLTRAEMEKSLELAWAIVEEMKRVLEKYDAKGPPWERSDRAADCAYTLEKQRQHITRLGEILAEYD